MILPGQVEVSSVYNGIVKPSLYTLGVAENFSIVIKALTNFSVDRIRFFDETPRRMALIHVQYNDEFVVPVSEKVFMRLKMEGH